MSFGGKGEEMKETSMTLEARCPNYKCRRWFPIETSSGSRIVDAPWQDIYYWLDDQGARTIDGGCPGCGQQWSIIALDCFSRYVDDKGEEVEIG